jgi:hypothetical protein
MARQGTAGHGTATQRPAPCGRTRERSERAGARTKCAQEHERSECDVDSERSELALNVFYFS